MDLLELLKTVLPAFLGGSLVSALLTAWVQHRRTERIDRVEQLAKSQQGALDRAITNENMLRERLWDQKRELQEMDAQWRERFENLERRYQQKCDEIEAKASERETHYEKRIAELTSEILRLKAIMRECGIDPNADTPLPQGRGLSL